MKKNQFVKVISLVLLIAMLFTIISSCSAKVVEKLKVTDIKIESTQNGSTTYIVTFEDGSTSTIVSKSQEESGDKITIGENGNFFINGVDTGISSKKGDEKEPDKKTWKSITVPLYNISSLPYDSNDSRYYDEEKPLSNLKVDDYSFIVADGEKEILYATVDTFAAMHKSDIVEQCSSEVTKSGSVSTWTLKDKDGKEVYRFSVDFDKKTISSWGNPEEVIKSFSLKTTLLENVKLTVTEVENAGKPAVYSFADYDLDAVEYEGNYYLSLGLLSVHVQHDIQRKFCYSSFENLIIEYQEDEQVDSSFTFGETYGVVATPKKMMTKSMEQYTETVDNVRIYNPPKYMLEYSKNLVLYVMDNYYGLASVLGYKNMREYINNTVYADKFLAKSPEERGAAYAILMSLLNDMHTGYTASVYLGENLGMFGTRYAQTLLGDRIVTNQMLNSLRQAELDKNGEGTKPNTVRYSQDGKVAYFSFDEFQVGKYFEEGELSENQLGVDTFKMFVKNLNEIRDYKRAEGAEKGTVETVVIDDSLNGGGYVAVMGKLLALLSKNNYAKLYFKNDNSGLVYKYEYSVDINNDGQYDDKDCFGQHFRFVIITTPYSFSCGNAFPYYAQWLELATIAGYKSGGGECTVDSIVFPFGNGMNHSSNFHIGSYDENTKVFVGDEGGASPKLPMTFNFYDIEKVAERLAEYFKPKS